MKKLLRFIVPFIWLGASFYLVSLMFDLMNTPSNITVSIGSIGILLIIYLAVVTRLGMKLLTKTKDKQ